MVEDRPGRKNIYCGHVPALAHLYWDRPYILGVCDLSDVTVLQ